VVSEINRMKVKPDTALLLTLGESTELNFYTKRTHFIKVATNAKYLPPCKFNFRYRKSGKPSLNIFCSMTDSVPTEFSCDKK
jgi:hypothetical protein